MKFFLIGMTFLSSILLGTEMDAKPFLYYQTMDGIYSFDHQTMEVQQVMPDIIRSSRRFSFSQSGHLLAYADAEGIWITPIDHWEPQKVMQPFPNNTWPFRLEWSPDDSRLTVILHYWLDNLSLTYPLSYSFVSEKVEPWLWQNCNQIVQHNLTGDFGMVCTAYEELNTQNIEPIVWQLGDHITEYEEKDYTIILGGSSLYYDWGISDKGQNLVYLSQNEQYELWGEYSFWKLNSLWNHEIAFEITHSYPSIKTWIAVSNDRSLLAYSGFCDYPLPYCIQIADNETGEIIWNSSDMMQLYSLIDVEWYPDDRYLAVLGSDRDHQEMIYIFDVQTGESIRYDVGWTTGIIFIK